MKYFTKYLPVEGEIKEGETGISVNNATYTHYNHLGKDYGKPAKLFLCSRNIQVGDKCFCLSVEEGNKEQPNMWIDPWRIRGEKDTCTTCIKVIGEVSPEATWVKEGMEFLAEGDECEVFPLHTHHRVTEEIIYLDEYNDPLKEGRLPIFKIKGPCGHFH